MKSPRLTDRFHYPCALLCALLLVLAAPTASARIARSRPSASTSSILEGESPLWSPLYSMVIGSGFEYQSDSEQTEYGFPFLIEYNFTELAKLNIEPKYSHISDKTGDGRSVSGFGDLETMLSYEFVRERRYRPAVSVEGGIRWPTASNSALGEDGHDYSIGLLVSKEIVFVNLDFNVIYNFIGEPGERDTVELSLATGWRLNHYVELIAEVNTAHPVGHVSASGSQGSSEIEGLIGIAWQVSRRLKLEQGVVFKEHGVQEFVFAWEWSFGGD